MKAPRMLPRPAEILTCFRGSLGEASLGLLGVLYWKLVFVLGVGLLTDFLIFRLSGKNLTTHNRLLPLKPVDPKPVNPLNTTNRSIAFTSSRIPPAKFCGASYGRNTFVW